MEETGVRRQNVDYNLLSPGSPASPFIPCFSSKLFCFRPQDVTGNIQADTKKRLSGSNVECF
jgi:hypothetical protein